MATVLDKDVTRESSVKFDEREIQITLTADQKVSMKLKGMKSGTVDIPIETLYKQLVGDASINTSNDAIVEIQPDVKIVKKVKSTEDNPMISLNQLRRYNNISVVSMEIKVAIEKVLLELLNKDINELPEG